MALLACGRADPSGTESLTPAGAARGAEACPWEVAKDLLFDVQVDAEAPAEARLPASALRADLACLKAVFQEEYSAAKYYADRGVNLSERVDALSAALPAELSQADFVTALLALHKDAPDTHLAYFTETGGKLSGKHLPANALYATTTAFGAGGPRACAGMQAQPALDERGQAGPIRFVGQFSGSTPATVACTGADGRAQTLAVAPVALDALPDSAKTFSFSTTAEGYLYVRLPLMTPGISPEQQRLLDRLADPAAAAPIIFDVRQNRGGDDTFAAALASTLRAVTDPLPAGTSWNMASLYSAAANPNIDLLIGAELDQSGDPAGAAAFRQQYAGELAAFNQAVAADPSLQAFRATPVTESRRPGQRRAAYPRPIVVLTDKGCASSCESLLQDFSRSPGVYRIGTHSAGALHFGNIGALLLPRSKVMFYGGQTGFDGDGEPAEGVGFAPDYYVIGQDSLAAAKRFLKTLP